MASEQIRLGSHLGTSKEGAALQELKPHLLTLADKNVDVASLQIIAAVAPAFWMVGLAKVGHELVTRLSKDVEDSRTVGIGTSELDEMTRKAPRIERAQVQIPEGMCSAPLLDENKFVCNLPKELLLAACFDGGGMNAYACTAYLEAGELHSQALRLCDEFLATTAQAHRLDAFIIRSRALDGLGRVARESGEYDRSWKLHMMALHAAEEGFAFQKSSAEQFCELSIRPSLQACWANALSNAGVTAFRSKDFALAKQCHTDACAVRKKIGDLRGVSSCLGNLALLAADDQETVDLYEQSLAIRIQLGDTWGVAGSHRALGHSYTKMKDISKAGEHLASAVPIFMEVNDKLGIAECLESLGLILVPSNPENAAKLLGAAVGLRRATGSATDVVLQHAEAKQLRDAQGENWLSGEQMGIADACKLAAQVADTVKSTQ